MTTIHHLYTIVTFGGRAILVSALLWGIFELDRDGRTLTQIQASLTDISHNMTELRTTVAGLARDQSNNERAIAAIKEGNRP